MTERKIALSIEEAADYTGIGRNTLRKLVEWKKLPRWIMQSFFPSSCHLLMNCIMQFLLCC